MRNAIFKRVISFMLALIMVFSYFVPVVEAVGLNNEPEENKVELNKEMPETVIENKITTEDGEIKPEDSVMVVPRKLNELEYKSLVEGKEDISENNIQDINGKQNNNEIDIFEMGRILAETNSNQGATVEENQGLPNLGEVTEDNPELTKEGLVTNEDKIDEDKEGTRRGLSRVCKDVAINEGDEENLECIRRLETEIVWLINGEESHKTEQILHWENGTSSARARIKYRIESNRPSAPGEVKIIVPKRIHKTRNGEQIGEYELSVPASPSTVQPIAYTETKDSYIFVNEKELPATAAGYLDLRVIGVDPLQVYDMSAIGKTVDGKEVTEEDVTSFPLNVTVKVHREKGVDKQDPTKTIPQSAEISSKDLTLKITTDAYITEVESSPGAYVSDLQRRQGEEIFPSGTFPTQQELDKLNYVYKDIDGNLLTGEDRFEREFNDGDWVYTYYDFDSKVHYTQPYTSRFVLGQPKTDDDKLGEIVAYRTSKDGKLHLPDEKNEQKFGYREGTGVRVFVKFKRKDLEAFRFHKLYQPITYYVTGKDDQEESSKPGEAYTIYRPIRFEGQRGRIEIYKRGLTRSNVGVNMLLLNKDVPTEYEAGVGAFGMPFTLPANAKPEDFEKYVNYKGNPYKVIMTDQLREDSQLGIEGVDYTLTGIHLNEPTFRYYGKYPKAGYGPYELNGEVVYGNLMQGAYGYMDIRGDFLPIGEVVEEEVDGKKVERTLTRQDTINRIKKQVAETTYDVYLIDKQGKEYKAAVGEFIPSASSDSVDYRLEVKQVGNLPNGVTFDAKNRKFNFKEGHDIVSYKVEVNTTLPATWVSASTDVTLKSDTEGKFKKVAEERKNEYQQWQRINDSVDATFIPSSHYKGIFNGHVVGYNTIDVVINQPEMSVTSDQKYDIETGDYTIKYSATMKNKTNLDSCSEMKIVTENNLISQEKHSKWYFLIPDGEEVDMASIRSDGKVISAKVEKGVIPVTQDKNGKPVNRKVGQDVLIVETERTPRFNCSSDTTEVTFSTHYPYMARKAFGNWNELVGVYEGDHRLGNHNTNHGLGKDFSGKIDDYSNYRDYFSKDTSGITKYLTDRTRNYYNPLERGVVGAFNTVAVNNRTDYSTGTLKNDSKNAYLDTIYKYQINYETGANTTVGNIQIMDIFENIGKEDSTSQSDKGSGLNTANYRFEGEFAGVETDLLDKQGVDYTIYLTKKDLKALTTNVDSDASREHSKKTFDVNNKANGWFKWNPKTEEVPKGVKAIIVDYGKDFELKPKSGTSFKIKMRAPTAEEVRKMVREQALKNNKPFPDNQPTDEELTYLISDIKASNVFHVNYKDRTTGVVNEKSTYLTSDRTLVGLKPFKLVVDMYFEDDNNRDGLRNETTISGLRLLRNGKVVKGYENFELKYRNKDNAGDPYNKNNFIPYRFESVPLPYLDDNGVPYHYTVEQNSLNSQVEGKDVDLTKDSEVRGQNLTNYKFSYIDQETSEKTFKDIEINGIKKDYTLPVTTIHTKNVHVPYKIPVVAVKTWKGETSKADRPESLTLTLLQHYKEDNVEKVREVAKQKMTGDKNSDRWTLNFPMQYLNYPDGQPYRYSIAEGGNYYVAYKPGKLAEADKNGDSLEIINEYHPYGDIVLSKSLIDATPKAKEQKFTFKFQVYQDNTPINAQYEYIKYSVDKETGKGKITSGGTIDLEVKDGKLETAIIRNVPIRTKVVFTELEKAGFTPKAKEVVLNDIRTGCDGEYTLDICKERLNTAHFENIYKATGELEIKGKKDQLGKDLEANKYLFNLYGAKTTDKDTSKVFVNKVGNTYEINKDKLELINSVRNNENKEFIFKLLKYNSKEDLTVANGEILGTNLVDGKANLQYLITETYADEETVYAGEDKVSATIKDKGYELDLEGATLVDVTITDNGDGTLIATPKYTKLGAFGEVKLVDDIDFQNNYTARGDLRVVGYKDIKNGFKPADKEFTFKLFEEKLENYSDLEKDTLTGKKYEDAFKDLQELAETQNTESGRIEFNIKNHYSISENSFIRVLNAIAKDVILEKEPNAEFEPVEGNIWKPLEAYKSVLDSNLEAKLKELEARNDNTLNGIYKIYKSKNLLSSTDTIRAKVIEDINKMLNGEVDLDILKGLDENIDKTNFVLKGVNYKSLREDYFVKEDSTNNVYKHYVAEVIPEVEDGKPSKMKYDKSILVFATKLKDNDKGVIENTQEYLGKYIVKEDGTLEFKKKDDKDNKLPIITNEYENGKLKVEKHVEGENQFPNKLFKFTVKLKGHGVENIKSIKLERDLKIKNKDTGKYEAIPETTNSVVHTVRTMANNVAETFSNMKDSVLEFSSNIIPGAVQGTGTEKDTDSEAYLQYLIKDMKVPAYMANDKYGQYGWKYYRTDSGITYLTIQNVLANSLDINFMKNDETSEFYKKNYDGNNQDPISAEMSEIIEKWNKTRESEGLIIKGWVLDKTTKDSSQFVLDKDTENQEDWLVPNIATLQKKLKDLKAKQEFVDELTNNKNLTLYAVWGPKGYTVNFESGSDSAGGSMESITAEFGETTIDWNKDIKFYNKGQRFNGFTTGDEALDKKIINNGNNKTIITVESLESIKNQDNLTLKALWTPINDTYNVKNGEFSFELMEGESVTLPDLPAGVTYEVIEEPTDGWGLKDITNPEGKIEPLETKEVVATNQYGLKDITVDLNENFKLVKYLDGKQIDETTPNNPVFKFNIEKVEDGIEGKQKWSVTSSKDGTIELPKMRLTSDDFVEIKAEEPPVDVDVHGPDVNVHGPDLDVHGPKVDIDIPDVNVDGPKVDIDVPDVDINPPKETKFKTVTIKVSEDTDSLKGTIYQQTKDSPQEYEITLKLKYDGESISVVEKSMKVIKPNELPITPEDKDIYNGKFENETLKAPIQLTKVVTGKNVPTGQKYNFELITFDKYDNQEIEHLTITTGQNDNKVTSKDYPIGTRYMIREITKDLPENTTYVLTKYPSGRIIKDNNVITAIDTVKGENNNVTITNDYKYLSSGEIKLFGNKTLVNAESNQNKKLLQDGDYQFEVKQYDGDKLVSTNIIKNNKGMMDSFAEFKKAQDNEKPNLFLGEYKFNQDNLKPISLVINEVIPDEKVVGMDYDTNSYKVVLNPVDDNNGTINVETEILKLVSGKEAEKIENVEFINTYTEGSGQLKLDKVVNVPGYEQDNIPPQLKTRIESETFEINVKTWKDQETKDKWFGDRTNPEYQPTEEIIKLKYKDDAWRMFRANSEEPVESLTFENGTVYEVEEVNIPEKYNFVKSTDTKDVDKNSGVIRTNTLEEVVFTNMYELKDKVEVQFNAKKDLQDFLGEKLTERLNKSTFKFELANEKGEVLEEVANNGSEINFSSIFFTSDDLVTTKLNPETNKEEKEYLNSKTFTYTIRERNDRQIGVTYDDTLYTIKVTLTRDAQTGDLNYTVDREKLVKVKTDADKLELEKQAKAYAEGKLEAEKQQLIKQLDDSKRIPAERKQAMLEQIENTYKPDSEYYKGQLQKEIENFKRINSNGYKVELTNEDTINFVNKYKDKINIPLTGLQASYRTVFITTALLGIAFVTIILRKTKRD